MRSDCASTPMRGSRFVGLDSINMSSVSGSALFEHASRKEINETATSVRNSVRTISGIPCSIDGLRLPFSSCAWWSLPQAHGQANFSSSCSRTLRWAGKDTVLCRNNRPYRVRGSEFHIFAERMAQEHQKEMRREVFRNRFHYLSGMGCSERFLPFRRLFLKSPKRRSRNLGEASSQSAESTPVETL